MNDNNFGLNDIIKYYENQGYIFYNLSEIKTLKDYIKFDAVVNIQNEFKDINKLSLYHICLMKE